MRPILSLVLLALLASPFSLLAGEDTKAEDEKPSKTIKWATASEVDNFGYDVYRSESEEGPFDRLTEDPIEGAGTTDEPSYYQFVDDTIDPRKDYYYYVESISIHGERERFTPVQKVKASLNPDGTPKKKKAKSSESEGNRR